MTPPRASSIFPRDQEGSAQARRTAPGRKVAPLPELRDVTITEYGLQTEIASLFASFGIFSRHSIR